MAPQPPGSVALLRASTFRISSTPIKQLPSVTPQITGAIWNCRDLLSTPTDAKQNSEASVVVHRFKTQLSTLLQDRSIEGRWAAVVLVKSTIEAGGIEVLSKCNAWVKSLLGILKKPDPPTTRSLAVLTLTRIFMLTWDYSNLVREITTPALTAFVPTCLSNIENKRCSSTELETVLEAFSVLLPRHPTIFRTNESKLRTYLSNVLSSNDAVMHYTEACRTTASRLLVQLHGCAPKQGGSDKWAETLKSSTTPAHATCDRIFRCVDEDWESVDGVEITDAVQAPDQEVESESQDAAGLKPWKGIYAGSERLMSLLDLIRSHLTTATSATVSIRIGSITDLLKRLFSIALSSSGNQDFVKFNNQISKDEREAMLANLPNIHVAAIQVCEAIIERFGGGLAGCLQLLVEQVARIFKAERSITEVRVATYRLMGSVLTSVGPAMSKADVAEIAAILESSCEDVLPSDHSHPSNGVPNGGGIKQQLGLSGSKTVQSHPADTTEIRQAAIDFLRTALDRLDAVLLPPKLRTQIDRVAVLSGNQDLLFASVLNPHRKQNDVRVQPSLLPVLAREFGDHPQVEALLRPRMPPIRTKMTGQLEEEENELDEDESADEENAEGHDGFETAEESPSEPQTSKRPAIDDPESSISAKRIRASPVVKSLLPDTESALPGPEPAQPQDDIPSAVTLPAPSEETVTAFQSTTNQPSPVDNAIANTASGALDEEPEDSDVEMNAPLTMEPDTDSEDEEDD